MKIGIFTEAYKPIINGVVNSIVGFKRGLEEQGHEVYVFCPTYKNHEDDPDDKNIVHMKSFPLPRGNGYHFIFPAEKHVKEIAQNMDVIHVHHPFIMGARAAVIAKTLGKPLVFTNHTQYEQFSHYVPLPKILVKNIIKRRLKNFTNQVDLIVAPAQGIISTLREYGAMGEIEIVPNGIDVDRFAGEVSNLESQKLLEQLNLDSQSKILIYTGRISEEKNLGFLLEALEKLIKKDAGMRLLMVGGGPQMNKIESLINEMDLGEKAIITDYVPYHEMHKYLNLARLYVSASKSEVHPLTILEGMAAGLPAVVVDAPGTGDIVTHNVDGLIAKDDLEDFVSKIETVLNDPLLYQQLSAGARQSAKEYSFQRTSKVMLGAHQKAIQIHSSKTQINPKTSS